MGHLSTMLLSEGSTELMNFIKEQPHVQWNQTRICFKSRFLTPQPEVNRASGQRPRASLLPFLTKLSEVICRLLVEISVGILSLTLSTPL